MDCPNGRISIPCLNLVYPHGVRAVSPVASPALRSHRRLDDGRNDERRRSIVNRCAPDFRAHE